MSAIIPLFMAFERGSRSRRFVFGHPDFADVYIWMLGTKDAHGVYEKLGFATLPDPQNWMWIKKPRKS